MSLKRKALYTSLATLVLIISTIFLWEKVRTPLYDWFSSEPIVYERAPKEVSEYELWLKGVDVQKQLNVMFERYQLDQTELELKAKEKELENAKEQLRAKELELGSLE